MCSTSKTRDCAIYLDKMWLEILLIIATLLLFLYWFIAKNFGKWERLGKDKIYL